MNPLILIAAGGTGGHIFPGLAVAEEMVARLLSCAWSSWDRRPLSASSGGFVPKAGLKLHLLPVLPLNTASLAARLRGLAACSPGGCSGRWLLLLRTRPSAVLGIGGYASGPLVLMASLLRIPTVLLEPNAIPGFTNRMLKPFVRQAACAFESTLPRFGDKGVLTGNPVRSSFQGPSPAASQPPLQLLCFGGSQGSQRSFRGFGEGPSDPARRRRSLSIVHQTGAAQHEAGSGGVPRGRTKGPGDAVHRQHVGGLRKRRSACCAASGATTLAELTVAGKAAILVPLRTAAEDHQTWNAKALVAEGAAVMLAESELRTLGAVVSALRGRSGDGFGRSRAERPGARPAGRGGPGGEPPPALGEDAHEGPPLSGPFHFIGIGGAGMSPLAEILRAQGQIVSGSDEKGLGDHGPALGHGRQDLPGP